VTGVDSYTLLRAPVTTNPSKTGDFETINTSSITPDALGRYSFTDTPPIRQAYKYRLVANDGAGSYVAAETDLNTDPFLDYGASTISVSSTNIGTAYAAQVTISAPSTYPTDLYVDIYRATVPANAGSTPGIYQNVAVEDGAFGTTPITTLALKDGITYTDTGLVIGTNYVYRHVVKYGATAATAKELRNTSTTNTAYTGFVQTASRPNISSAPSTPVTITGTSTNRAYLVVSGTNLGGAQLRIQTRSTTAAATDPWTDDITTGLTIGNNSRITQYTNTAAQEWSNTATGVTTGDYYFYLEKANSATAPTNTNIRIVLVDQNGNTPASTGSTVTWW
jgi:hypothetical protein